MPDTHHIRKGELGDITVKLIASFKTLIAEGTFVPGSKLPPERDLAKSFGVNRSSLRQALKVLQLLGVLRQRVGDGTYLTADASNVLRVPIEFMLLIGRITDEELFDARLLVEPHMAARAAQQTSAKELAALEKAIMDMKNCKTSQQRMETDLAFHQAIFQASGNRLYHMIFAVIHLAILRSMGRLVKRSRLDRPLEFHKQIYTAIYNRDPKGAYEWMEKHLLDTKSQLTVQPRSKVNLELVMPIVRDVSGSARDLS